MTLVFHTSPVAVIVPRRAVRWGPVKGGWLEVEQDFSTPVFLENHIDLSGVLRIDANFAELVAVPHGVDARNKWTCADAQVGEVKVHAVDRDDGVVHPLIGVAKPSPLTSDQT